MRPIPQVPRAATWSTAYGLAKPLCHKSLPSPPIPPDRHRGVQLGLALVGPQNTGKIMAWVGTAMYAAFALGAPVGTALYAAYGLAAIALATTLVPLSTLLLVGPRRRPTPALRSPDRGRDDG